MKIKKILLRAAIIISVLLLIFKGFLMYRNHVSYKNVIHKNANNIIKIQVDEIIQSLVFNAIKNPSYYYNNRESKEDSLDDQKQKQNKGYSIPANVFLYTIKGKSPSTLVTSFKISDKAQFKTHLKSHYKLESFKDSESFSIVSSNDKKFVLAFNDNQCVLVYNPSKENVKTIFEDLLDKDYTLDSDDKNWSKIKHIDSHIGYISTSNDLSLNFNNGVLDLEGFLTISNDLQVPQEKQYLKFSEDSSLKFYLNMLYVKNKKKVAYNDLKIELDSINKYYRGNLALEIANVTMQEDSIVSYEYNDDFEKIETFSVVKKEVPEINIQLGSNPLKLYNYLERISVIDNGKLNKNHFPLYQMKIDSSLQSLHASTNLTQKITHGKVVNLDVFFLDIDFERLQKQNHFPLINDYIEKLLNLKINGKLNDDKVIVNGELTLKNQDINALAQLAIKETN